MGRSPPRRTQPPVDRRLNQRMHELIPVLSGHQVRLDQGIGGQGRGRGLKPGEQCGISQHGARAEHGQRRRQPPGFLPERRQPRQHPPHDALRREPRHQRGLLGAPTRRLRGQPGEQLTDQERVAAAGVITRFREPRVGAAQPALFDQPPDLWLAQRRRVQPRNLRQRAEPDQQPAVAVPGRRPRRLRQQRRLPDPRRTSSTATAPHPARTRLSSSSMRPSSFSRPTSNPVSPYTPTPWPLRQSTHAKTGPM